MPTTSASGNVMTWTPQQREAIGAVDAALSTGQPLINPPGMTTQQVASYLPSQAYPTAGTQGATNLTRVLGSAAAPDILPAPPPPSPPLSQLATSATTGGGSPTLSGLASQAGAQANSALSYAPPGMYFNPYTQTPFFFGGGDENAWIAAQTPLVGPSSGPQADFNQAVANWAAGTGPPIVGAGGIGGISAAASPGLAGAPGTGPGSASSGGSPGSPDGSPAPTAPSDTGFESGFASVGPATGPSVGGASGTGPFGGGVSATGLGGALAGGGGYGSMGTGSLGGATAAEGGYSGGFGFGPGVGSNAGTSVGGTDE